MRKLATIKRLFDDRALYCQLIVTRRCNLACGYCNEFDKVSQPVPFETLTARERDEISWNPGLTGLPNRMGSARREMKKRRFHVRADPCATAAMNSTLPSTPAV